MTAANILTAGLLYNIYHSPYDGISPLTPQQSTVKRNTIAWMPYVRDQQSFGKGALLDVGAGFVSIRDGYEPHGSAPYEYTPEQTEGSYFENLSGRSQRLEGTATLYLPARQWMGRHDVKAGLDLDHIAYDQRQMRTPVSYLREDGTLERQSTFAAAPAFTMHNGEIGAFVQDRWQPAKGWARGLLVEPGLRFDWDEIVRRPLFAPRLAVVYAPGDKDTTKISAGIGLYYEHTQLEYLTQTHAGTRSDTYYAADGVTPMGPAQQTEFSAEDSLLHAPRALNWSVGVERKLPWAIYAGANFMEKRTTNVFTFANESGSALGGAAALAGNYVLTNGREDRYSSEEFDARKPFGDGYTVFLSYTHSSARTNAALDYLPTPSPLGTQQSGPLPWDVPNRFLSWGWLPIPLQDAEEALGFCVHARRAYGLSVHGGECGTAGGWRGGWAEVSEFQELQPGARVEISFSRTVLGTARRDGECDGQRKCGSGEQRGGLAGVWDIQRDAGAGIHGEDPADRGEISGAEMPQTQTCRPKAACWRERRRRAG